MARKTPDFYKQLAAGPIPDVAITGGQVSYLRRNPDKYAEVLAPMEAALTAARVKNFAKGLFREGAAPVSPAHAAELVRYLTGAEVA